MFLLAVLLWGCHSKKAEQQTNAVYTSTTPLVTDVNLPQSYVANIQSLRNIEVRSQQEGILQQIFVSEGQHVRAGQPLFRIAIVGEDEEIAKARSEQEQAEIDLQNTSKLTENNVISPNAKRMQKLNCSLPVPIINLPYYARSWLLSAHPLLVS